MDMSLRSCIRYAGDAGMLLGIAVHNREVEVVMFAIVFGTKMTIVVVI